MTDFERSELNEYRKQELCQLMSDISEDYYCAGWLIGLEYTLWAMVADPHASRLFGMGEVSAEEVSRLRELSQAVDGWWRWVDNEDDRKLPPQEWGNRFVRMSAWLPIYQAHVDSWDDLRSEVEGAPNAQG